MNSEVNNASASTGIVISSDLGNPSSDQLQELKDMFKFITANNEEILETLRLKNLEVEIVIVFLPELKDLPDTVLEKLALISQQLEVSGAELPKSVQNLMKKSMVHKKGGCISDENLEIITEAVNLKKAPVEVVVHLLSNLMDAQLWIMPVGVSEQLLFSVTDPQLRIKPAGVSDVMKLVHALKGCRSPLTEEQAELADLLARIARQLEESGAELSKRVRNLFEEKCQQVFDDFASLLEEKRYWKRILTAEELSLNCMIVDAVGTPVQRGKKTKAAIEVEIVKVKKFYDDICEDVEKTMARLKTMNSSIFYQVHLNVESEDQDYAARELKKRGYGKGTRSSVSHVSHGVCSLSVAAMLCLFGYEFLKLKLIFSFSVFATLLSALILVSWSY